MDTAGKAARRLDWSHAPCDQPSRCNGVPSFYASASALLCSRYCSQFGGGSYYEVYVGDTLIKHGGVFTFSETVQFP